jgi:hypothetical protein
VAPGVGPQVQLGGALPGHQEQRAERGHDQVPVRHRDVGAHGAGEGPDHEARRHHHDVDDRHVLEPVGVRRGGGHVEGDDGHGGPGAGGGRHGQRGRQQADAERPGGARRDRPGRHRAVPLAGVEAVGLGVGDVVEAVGAARGQAEGHEDHRRAGGHVELVEDAGRRRGGEHQEVLDPLAGPQQAQHLSGARGSWRRGGSGGHGGMVPAGRHATATLARRCRPRPSPTPRCPTRRRARRRSARRRGPAGCAPCRPSPWRSSSCCPSTASGWRPALPWRRASCWCSPSGSSPATSPTGTSCTSTGRGPCGCWPPCSRWRA